MKVKKNKICTQGGQNSSLWKKLLCVLTKSNVGTIGQKYRLQKGAKDYQTDYSDAGSRAWQMTWAHQYAYCQNRIQSTRQDQHHKQDPENHNFPATTNHNTDHQNMIGFSFKVYLALKTTLRRLIWFFLINFCTANLEIRNELSRVHGLGSSTRS